MQSKNTSAVLAAFAKVPFDPTNALFQPQFQPVEDNITVFHDYSALASAGKFAKLVSLYFLPFLATPANVASVSLF
jgi:hypothetical protein